MPPVPDVEPRSFAADFGAHLRSRRRLLRLRLRHLADANLPAATLRAAERGEVLLDRTLITRLASRYGLDLADVLAPRESLWVGEGRLGIGDVSVPCEVGRLDAMLGAYLEVVRMVRTDPTDPPQTVRRDDIRCLADHLDTPCTVVLSRLADIVDASGAETRAMIDLYLTGASVVGLHAAS